MYSKHPSFLQPLDETVKVWRYMDFTKFVSLLESRSLHFARIDKLVEDPFEGSYPKLNVLARQTPPVGLPAEHHDVYVKAMAEDGAKMARNMVKMVGVNCWHMNPHESAAMWSLYLKGSNGVAIQSTYRKFRDCFAGFQGDIFIGEVRYIDYESEFIDGTPNAFAPFAYKRKSFEHEKEVRATIVRMPPTVEGIGWNFEAATFTHGELIPIDLDLLVEKVHVAPNSPEWFVDLVRSVLNRYGAKFEVMHSQMNAGPLW
jgi:hypothetical protein